MSGASRAISFSGTAAALGTTEDLSTWGLPFKKLRFTKSGAADTGTVRLGVGSNGGLLVDISTSGVETVKIEASVDGTNFGSGVVVEGVNAAGTYVARGSANALADGTYIIVTV